MKRFITYDNRIEVIVVKLYRIAAIGFVL